MERKIRHQKTGKKGKAASGGPPIRSYLLAVFSGLLLYASFPPLSCWFLAWVSLVPLFFAVYASPDFRGAANVGGVAGLVFYGLSLSWFLRVLGPAAPALWCMLALWPALFCVAARFTLRERFGAFWPVFAGLAWCGIEYFRSEIWIIKFAWMGLGFSQVPLLPALQLCSVFGVYGLSAFIVGFNAALYLSLARREWRPAALASVTVLAALAWGNYRLARYPLEDGRGVKVALLQDESLGLERQLHLSRAKKAGQFDLLVWPEYSFMIPAGREKQHMRMLLNRLAGIGAVKVVGVAITPPDKEKIKVGDAENLAVVIEHGGGIAGRYGKMHPIPFVEPFLVPNKSPAAVKTSIGTLGIQICYDLDFENGSRMMVGQGAEILVVPDMDPWEWGRLQHVQHSEMAPVRAVESGLWAVRAASSGFSQMISPVGRVVREMGFGEEGLLTGKVFMKKTATVYSRFGWIMAPFSMIFTIVLLGGIVLVRLFEVRGGKGYRRKRGIITR